MNTAIFSVVYPGIDEYFSEFLSTLSRQSSKNFTLFLINDGFVNVREFLKRCDFDVKVIDVDFGSPAALRKMGIQWIIESGAEIIIFADSDDYFAENRVEILNNILDKNDLVFNELILTGQGLSYSTPMLGRHFSDGEVVDCKRIRTANCMGLSNTAIRVNGIPMCFDQLPDNIIAFDWTFFALCLHAGVKGVFTKRTATYYRQHENNLANPCDLKEEQILRGVMVKSEHYKVLSCFYKEYMSLANIFNKLLVQLQSSETLKGNYCQAVREHAPAMPLWWEPMKSLEELGL